MNTRGRCHSRPCQPHTCLAWPPLRRSRRSTRCSSLARKRATHVERSSWPGPSTTHRRHHKACQQARLPRPAHKNTSSSPSSDRLSLADHTTTFGGQCRALSLRTPLAAQASSSPRRPTFRMCARDGSSRQGGLLRAHLLLLAFCSSGGTALGECCEVTAGKELRRPASPPQLLLTFQAGLRYCELRSQFLRSCRS